MGMKGMLITGATGSLGTELVAQFYGKYEIYAQGRDAQKLLKLKMRYRPQSGARRPACHGLREAVQCSASSSTPPRRSTLDLAEQHLPVHGGHQRQLHHELASWRPQGRRALRLRQHRQEQRPDQRLRHHQVPGGRLILELATCTRRLPS